LDPPARDAIQKDISLARLVDKLDPLPPKEGKTFRSKDTIESIPADRVKGFAEVELKNSSWGGPLVAGLDDVGHINEVFGDGAARDKPGLVRMDKERNYRFETEGEALGVEFKGAVLKGDRPKIIRSVSSFLLRQQNNK
jgi:hypothetical protein